MTDQKPALTLADRALARLRQLATGNGIEPAAISVIEAQEDTFTMTGKMEVSPLCETEATSYPGSVKAKDRQPVPSASVLGTAVAKHRQQFIENPDWVTDTLVEIKAHESQGWGLEDAKVTLPQKSTIFAATETCPSCAGGKMLTCTQCNGQGTVVCRQCQGQGREPCYYCGGRGENPQQPGQPCTTCNGTRFAPCRYCQSRGYLACPTCQGRRGTACTVCQATGKITHEVAVTCGAETHFTLNATGLPSGLRRGLDRIGIAHLGKGHADIEISPPTEDEQIEQQGKSRLLILHYKTSIPYAELRMGMGTKKAVISVVGKRCALIGVPDFLDAPLKIWRDKLRLAALGKSPLAEAIEVRALKEILSLTVAGKGNAENVRKIYPYGLSSETIKSVLADMQLALNKTTLKTRTIIALVCVALCAVVFYGFFTRNISQALIGGWNRFVVLAVDVALLATALIASWALLNFSTRFVLKRRFPQLKLALQQKIGKTGYSMMSAIGAAFVVCILLAPVKPPWLLGLFK